MSGVAYALKVLHSERELFEQKLGWKIKKMETEDQSLVHDYNPEKLQPSPVQDEYAPVIFSQETVKHIISVDMMSGKVSHYICKPLCIYIYLFLNRINLFNFWLDLHFFFQIVKWVIQNLITSYFKRMGAWGIILYMAVPYPKLEIQLTEESLF